MSHVLVIDDEPLLSRTLAVNLVERGYSVTTADSGEAALSIIREKSPDVIVLDLGLPGIGGLEVMRRLRRWSQVPIIVLSARSEEADKVAALDAGADDYVSKPFGIDELFARLRVLSRRAVNDAGSPVVSTEDFTLNLENRTAQLSGGNEVRLTPTEWKIIECLVRREGRLVSRHQLADYVWNESSAVDSNLLRVHITNIRQKLEPNSSQPQYFLTEPRLGYRYRGSR